MGPCEKKKPKQNEIKQNENKKQNKKIKETSSSSSSSSRERERERERENFNGKQNKLMFFLRDEYLLLRAEFLTLTRRKQIRRTFITAGGVMVKVMDCGIVVSEFVI